MCVLNHISFHMSNIIGSSRLLIKLQMCDLPDIVSTWKYFLILDLRSFWAAALYWNLVLLSLSRVVPICDGTRGLSAYQRRLLLLQPHGRCSENWPPQWKGDEFPTIIQGFFFLSHFCVHIILRNPYILNFFRPLVSFVISGRFSYLVFISLESYWPFPIWIWVVIF